MSVRANVSNVDDYRHMIDEVGGFVYPHTSFIFGKEMQYSGLMLADMIAIQAMQGLLSGGYQGTYADLAANAYSAADAMIALRAHRLKALATPTTDTPSDPA